MNRYGPSLESGIRVRITLEDLEGYVLLAQTLSQAQAANACASNEDMHLLCCGRW
jgi:hypothetical protein